MIDLVTTAVKHASDRGVAEVPRVLAMKTPSVNPLHDSPEFTAAEARTPAVLTGMAHLATMALVLEVVPLAAVEAGKRLLCPLVHPLVS